MGVAAPAVGAARSRLNACNGMGHKDGGLLVESGQLVEVDTEIPQGGITFAEQLSPRLMGAMAVIGCR